jgi:hypothetical protein
VACDGFLESGCGYAKRTQSLTQQWGTQFKFPEPHDMPTDRSLFAGYVERERFQASLCQFGLDSQAYAPFVFPSTNVTLYTHWTGAEAARVAGFTPTPLQDVVASAINVTMYPWREGDFHTQPRISHSMTNIGPSVSGMSFGGVFHLPRPNNLRLCTCVNCSPAGQNGNFILLNNQNDNQLTFQGWRVDTQYLAQFEINHAENTLTLPDGTKINWIFRDGATVDAGQIINNYRAGAGRKVVGSITFVELPFVAVWA